MELDLEQTINGHKIDEELGLEVEGASPINAVDAMLLIARGLALVARSIKALGNGGAHAGPPGFEIGAIEGLGMVVKESMEELTLAISQSKGGA